MKIENEQKNIELLFNTKSKENFDDLLERPLEKKIFISFSIFLFSILIFFSYKLYDFQITNYSKYSKAAKNNFIKTEVLFSDRGIILDKNGDELV
jgi:cell division protein FtsI/penicillin-binding protein 2